MTWPTDASGFTLQSVSAITGTVPLTETQGLLALAAQNYEHAGDILNRRRQYAQAASAWNTSCVMWSRANEALGGIRACTHVVTLSLELVPELLNDPELPNTYVTLMMLYEHTGDECRARADSVCANENYSKAVESGNGALALALTSPEQQVLISERINTLQVKLSGGMAAP